MNLPQLQRDVREVEDELRLARNRLAHYQAPDEPTLAADAQRVVEGHEKLIATLTAKIQLVTRYEAALPTPRLHAPQSPAR